MTQLSRADKKWLRSKPTPSTECVIDLASQSEALRAIIRATRVQAEKPEKRGRKAKAK